MEHTFSIFFFKLILQKRGDIIRQLLKKNKVHPILLFLSVKNFILEKCAYLSFHQLSYRILIHSQKGHISPHCVALHNKL